MRLLLRGDFQNEILCYQINRIAHFDKFLVLFDCVVLGTNDAADHGDDVGAVLGRLQKGLGAVQIEGAGHAAFEHLDPVAHFPCVTEFFLDVAEESLFDFLCAHAIEIDRIRQIILNCLQLHRI